jgi:hypothetical protein
MLRAYLKQLTFSRNLFRGAGLFYLRRYHNKCSASGANIWKLKWHEL